MTLQKTFLMPIVGVATALLLLLAPLSVALAAAPTLSYSGGSAPFSTLQVSGGGFQAGEVVNLSLGLSNSSTTADGSGNFASAPLMIPNVASGLYYIVAVGQSSGLVAFSSVWVGGFYPTASPSNWYIPPGSTLTWSGSGFAPNEEIQLMHEGSELASFNADGSGSFSGAGASTVPYELRNSTATFSLVGQQSGINLTYMLAIADLYPWGNPSTWYDAPGTAVTFSGGGFGASEMVDVRLGGDTLTSFSVNNSGDFSNVGEVTLPWGTVAEYMLVGQESGASVSAPVTLASAYPSVDPSTWYAFSGTQVTFSGSGFAPNEAVTVSGAGTASTTTDGSGSFSVELPLPNTATATFTFVGATSGVSIPLTITVAERYTAIWFNNYWGQGGSPLTIFGSGFSSGEEVEFSHGGGTLFSTATAAGDGSISHATTMPFAPAGPIMITATGQSSDATASAETNVAPVYVDLQLGSYAGAPGTTVTLLGNGYLPNEPIEVLTDRTGSEVVHSFNAGPGGSFSNSGYVIPEEFAEGLLTLTVRSTNSFDEKQILFYVTGE